MPLAHVTRSFDHGFQLYFQRMASLNFLSNEEELAHIARAQRGDDRALNRLVRSNALFILKFCERFRGRGLAVGMTQGDLFSLATIGFVEAVRKFDASHDTRLNTYSAYWMLAELNKGIADTGRIIRLPIRLNDQLARAKKFAAKFAALHGEEPDAEQLSEGIGESVRLADKLLHSLPTVTHGDAPLRATDNHGDTTSVLDAYVSHESEEQTPLHLLVEAQETHGLHEALGKLTPIQREVLLCRFQDDLTLDETAAELHARGRKLLTRERMRQIQNAALKRLKLLLEEEP